MNDWSLVEVVSLLPPGWLDCMDVRAPGVSLRLQTCTLNPTTAGIEHDTTCRIPLAL